MKAVVQPTKQSIRYVFDRATGKPIWPIEEKRVPPGDVPGERYSPTQPMPTKPLAYGRTGTSVDELIDFTPDLRAREDAYRRMRADGYRASMQGVAMQNLHADGFYLADVYVIDDWRREDKKQTCGTMPGLKPETTSLASGGGN